MKKYHKRLIDDTLLNELQTFGAVLIVGPKWCGKTTTCMQHAESVLLMQNPDHRAQYISLAKLKPSKLLEGDKPRLIDEWQVAPVLWDAIRYDVDRTGEVGQYLLTGSTTVDESTILHSGAGRITRLMMRTMSLYESNDSNGQISLRDLFESSNAIEAQSSATIENIAEILVRGGWPGAMDKNPAIAKRQIAGYAETILKSDIHTIDGVKRDAEKMRSVLTSYARHCSTQASIQTIVNDIKNHHGAISRNTVSDYLNALRALFVIEELPAWSPRLRSKTTILASPTRHFVDPALAAYFLNASESNLMSDLETFGLLFESLVIRDLRIYAQKINGKLFHFRDKSGLEVDAIVLRNDGTWGAIEIKLGHAWVDEAANNLKKFSKMIHCQKMLAPSFLAVVTATGYGYTREDGVHVIPIGCLKD